MTSEYTPEELAIKRSEIARTKTMILNEVVELNGKMHGRGRLPNSEFQQLMRRKSELTKEVMRLDGQLTELKIVAAKMHQQDVLKKADKLHATAQEKPQEEPKKMIITRLNELRQHYQEFSADGTRSPTMRRMASEFALKLSGIIREAINKKD